MTFLETHPGNVQAILTGPTKLRTGFPHCWLICVRSIACLRPRQKSTGAITEALILSYSALDGPDFLPSSFEPPEMHLLVYQDHCVHVVLHRAASPAHVLRSYIHALRLVEALSGGLRGFILQKDESGIDAAELEAAVWMTEYYDRFIEKVRVALSFEQHAQCRSLF